MKRHVIFSSPSSSSSLFSLSLYSRHFSSSFSPHRRDDHEAARHVRVSVWWDFENCHVPNTVKPYKVAGIIMAALRANGIKGPVQITAFGDMFQLSRANQEFLSSTGITLTHVPSGGKNSADRSLLADLMYWVSQNPPPAHLLLISGDRDFASLLHKLRMNNYNILLATLDNAPASLRSAASIMWPWYDLLMSENLTGRYFNQPPDGPYGSWYGHYKTPLEDPFSSSVQPAVTQARRLPEPVSGSKPQRIPTCSEVKPSSVPETVIKHVRLILKSHPEGISIEDLRAQLERYNDCLDRSYYGYKKLSCLLASMPNILRMEKEGVGTIMIFSVTSSDGDNGNQLDFEDTTTSDSMKKKLSSPTSPEQELKQRCQKLLQHTLLDTTSSSPVDGKLVSTPLPEKLSSIDEKTLFPHPPDQMKPLMAPIVEKGDKVAETQETEPDFPPSVGQDSESDVGFYKRIWRNWFGSRVDVSGSSCNNQEQIHTSREGSDKEGLETVTKQCTSVDNCRNGKCEEKTSTCDLVDSMQHDKSSLAIESATSSELNADKAQPGLFKRIINKCKFRRSNPSHQSCDSGKLMESHSQEDRHFSNAFWGDMKSFMKTPKGSVIVSESRNREEMALNLQKEGPLFLRSLAKCDLLRLVDLLISEMKWVEEFPSQTAPFRLVQHDVETSLTHSNSSSSLHSIFSKIPSKDEMQRSAGLGAEKYKNVPHAGVSQPSIKNSLADESKKKILADCQKLSNEMLNEFQDGYYLSAFKPKFLKRFGYNLDFGMLGYDKLGDLLQSLDGVKVHPNIVVPYSKDHKVWDGVTVPQFKKHTVSHPVFNGDNHLNDSRKEDNSVSPWDDELGPLANAADNKNAVPIAPRRESLKSSGSDRCAYEQPVSDFSDSDGEAASGSTLEGQGKRRANEGDSSILELLDQWHANKSDLNTVDCRKPNASCGVDTNLGDPSRKFPPVKRYNFVAEPICDDKHRSIADILGTKSKSRMES